MDHAGPTHGRAHVDRCRDGDGGARHAVDHAKPIGRTDDDRDARMGGSRVIDCISTRPGTVAHDAHDRGDRVLVHRNDGILLVLALGQTALVLDRADHRTHARSGHLGDIDVSRIVLPGQPDARRLVRRLVRLGPSRTL